MLKVADTKGGIITFNDSNQLKKKAEDINDDYKNVGSGELPNKYYVSGYSDFFYETEKSNYGWASDKYDVGNRSENYGIFNTYEEAYNKVQEIISTEIEETPIKGGINTITIEDHISGEVYIASFYASKKPAGILGDSGWTYNFEEYDETNFTRKTMEEKGETFSTIDKGIKKKAEDFNEWFDRFLEEKDLPYTSWKLDDGTGESNMIDSNVVIEAIKNASPSEQSKIKDMIVKLDFANADILDYFKHLAMGLVKFRKDQMSSGE